MALLGYTAKFDPFLSLDCAPAPALQRSNQAQSKERKDHILPSSNLDLRDASLSVALRCDEEGPRGRYVVAMRKLQKGTLLFQV